jgi:hypothetical protein
VFSNQPIRAVVADGADAILAVLVSPSRGPTEPGERWNVVELGWRLRELASWRDVQSELRLLPPEWRREAKPAPLCVVEPEQALPGRMFAFDPKSAAELIAMGERDAWRALERAGWLADPGETGGSRPGAAIGSGSSAAGRSGSDDAGGSRPGEAGRVA